MPNDLTAKRNLLNARADARSEPRQKLASSGFTASIWTLSGVVLAACGSFEDFLGLDDNGGGGGGRSLHVQKSPVQGARLYFDTDDSGDVSIAERTAQDAQFPEGFVSDESGRVSNIPDIFYGKRFVAVLDDAIDGETGAALPDNEYTSIPDANGDHTLASPITEFIHSQSGDAKEVIERILDPSANEQADIDAFLAQILTPENYLGGGSGVEGLSVYLATEQSPTESDVQSQIMDLLPEGAQSDTLEILNDDDVPRTPIVDIEATIGQHDGYVATIQAVSHTAAARYNFVAPDGNGGYAPANISDFIINARGIISVAESAELRAGTTTLHVEISNGDAAQNEYVRVEITIEAAIGLSHADGTGNVDENDAGAIAVTGIETSAAVTATDFTISDGLGLADGVSYEGMFEMEAATGAPNTWNLKLIDTAMLDYEAIAGGVINLRVHVQPANNAPSNILDLAITVNDDLSDIAFSGDVSGEVTKDSEQYEVSGAITIANQDGASVDERDGTYGTLDFDSASGTWTYTLTNTDTTVQALLEGQFLIDTATLTVGGTTQNISINIMGANKDVHFLANNARTATASVEVEHGNPVLAAMDIFDGLTLMDATLADIEIEFVQTGGNYDLFTITDDGLLTFTGDNDDVASFDDSITLNLQITAPTLTTATLPFAVQVNVVNEDDDGRAEYAITENDAGTELSVALVDANMDDPDGVVGGVSFQWFTTDGTTNTPIANANADTLDISAAPNLAYGVTITYTDNHDIANGETTEFDVLASSVRFTMPPPATIDISEAASANYATLGANGDGVLATFMAESSEGEDVSYTFEALDDEGNAVIGATGLFSISNGAISLLSNVDFETTPQYTLIITASAPKEANSMEMDTAVAHVILNVVNDQDGDAEYEVTENDAGTILTAELVLGDLDINPDGVPTNVQYRWFTTADGGMTKNDIVGITDTTSATLDIDGYTPPSGEIIGVTVSYRDPVDVANDDRTIIDVLASPIDFTDGTNSVSSYTGTINEDGTLLADNAGDDIPLPQVMASVEDASMGSTIKYAFLVNAETGITTTSFLGFSIDFDDGTITVSSTIPDTDFNYDLDPVRDSITLTVRATYDSNGATTGGEVHTRDVNVLIAVNDLNDETPEFAPLQIVENSGAVAGIPTLAGATTGIDMLTGTAGADHITGGDGADKITSGGGNDHIFGDAGDDEITLSEAVGSVETIYYRFASSDSGDFAATDGTDTIKGFRRGEDKLVLIDTDGTLITLNDFLSDTHREQGGNLFVVPLLDSATGTILIGVQIDFGNTNALRIEYATDSQVADVRDTGGGLWQTAGDPYVGTNGANIVSGGVLNDNTLLRNYFNVNSGDDNLQVIGTADIPTIFGADVFISESRTSADGAFATISATDADVAVIDLSYRIAGGSGATIFELATDNTLSVASTATLNYETATEYTLELEASDGVNPAATQTITIGITDVNDVAPDITVSTGDGTLADGAAAGTDTDIRVTIADDARGDDFLITYANFIGSNITGFELRHISGTTYGLYTTEEFDLETNTAISGGGISMIIGVSDILDGTTTRTNEDLASVSITTTDTNDNGPTVTASQTDPSTPISLDEDIDDSTTPRNVMGLTIEIDDADVTAGHQTGVLGLGPIFRVLLASNKDPIPSLNVVEIGGKWVLQHTPTPQEPLKSQGNSSIEVIIEVSDGENPATESDPITITVNNVDEGPGVYRVDGTLMMGETLTVMQVTEDPDGVNGAVTYQWYKEAANGDITMLTADTGNPNQYTLQTGDDPDTELFGAFVIYNDNAGTRYTAEDDPMIEVQANLAPEITTSASTVTISTNMDRVQDVITIEATDRNTVDTLTYAFLVNGNPTLGTPGGLEDVNLTVEDDALSLEIGDPALLGDEGGFVIDPNTGRITFNGNLHHSAHESTVTLTVQVSDGTETDTVDITVDFLENTGTTTFAITYTHGAPDNFYVGTQLGIGNAVLDPDMVVTQFKYDYFRLVESTDPITGETIITEEDAFIQAPGGATAYVFTPEDVGHKILVRATYKDSIGNKELFEHTTAIVVPAPAEDSSTRVIVTEGIADNSVITYATLDGTINENTNLSYRITSIKDANDADVTSAGAFEIRDGDKTAGTIYRKQGLTNKLDHETSDSYTLTIEVTDDSNSPSTTSTHDIIIEVGDINESPTATESLLSGLTAPTVADGSNSAGDVTTGYRITLADEDGTNFNTMLTIKSIRDEFGFKEVSGQANTYELFLLEGKATTSNQIIATFEYSDGVNTVEDNVTVMVTGLAPAKIPNRPEPLQEVIIPDPAPDDDPLAGMTPMPDADPNG